MTNKLFKILIITVFVSAFCLSGCGNKSEEEAALADFSEAISNFTDYIKNADDQLNALNPEKEEAVDEMLSILDEMNTEFANLAEKEVPEQYQAIHELAVAASENMSEAVFYYHSAFEAENFNEQEADAAYEYYTRSMQDIEYIGYVLTGDDIPENDRIKIYEESDDSHLFEKWLPDNDNDDTE